MKKYLANFFKKNKKTEISLPHDDAFLKNTGVQWWYWTGHLEDEHKNKYGFEVVFFVFNSFIIFKNTLVQAAITDITENSYFFREKLKFCNLPKVLDSSFDMKAKEKNQGEVISARGGNGEDTLFFKVNNYEVKLDLKTLSKPVLHYEGKLHEYEFGGNSFYYARENMKTTGSIIKNGVESKVSGFSWFDRQYGDLYKGIFKGWEWFAIKLHNGEKIMLYHFLEEKYKKERFGSISIDDSTKSISCDDFLVTSISKWKSPNTGIIYPASWKIKVLGKDYKVFPNVKNQELRAYKSVWIGPEYWEGSCVVKDLANTIVGEAYVELNGYGKNKIFTLNLPKIGGQEFQEGIVNDSFVE